MGNTCVVTFCALLRREEKLSKFAFVQASVAEQEAEPCSCIPVSQCSNMTRTLVSRYFPCLATIVGINLKI